jgi:lipopolysaccharide/colanic/teichoic acid biosynthesis glycosyltransferase
MTSPSANVAGHDAGASARVAGTTASVPAGDVGAAVRPTTRAERLFDIAVCLLVLPAALLIGSVTALLIYIDSPGSVFYRSTRVGRGGREFQMLKFRKMRRSARGGPLTMSDDERFTPIGSFLTMTRLDELPQLWNVLQGEMRLVGPRPEVPEFVKRFPGDYETILTVLPGITGPAAVEYASEAHLLALQSDPLRYYAESIMPHKLQLDLDYVRGRSLVGDVRILVRTALVPVSKVLRSMVKDPRVRRVEAGLFLGVCAVLVVTFAIVSGSGG